MDEDEQDDTQDQYEPNLEDDDSLSNMLTMLKGLTLKIQLPVLLSNLCKPNEREKLQHLRRI